MGVEVRQLNSLERLAENPPDRRGTTPAYAFQATWFEQPGCPNRNPSGRKKGFVRSEQPLFRQKGDPVGNDPLDIRSDWEEYRRKGLAVLGADISCVMKDSSPVKIDMPYQH